MQLRLMSDEGIVYLMVPTYFDPTKKEWMGGVFLPKAKKMIFGNGKNSKELEQSFNDCLRKSIETESELAKEIFDLFQPLSYWEEMME
jgi:hypothetical protein